jgi:hypothetical protein
MTEMTEMRSLNLLLNKIFRKRYFVIIPLLILFLAGWTFNRTTQNPTFPSHGEVFENSKGIVNVGSRQDLCEELIKSNGYILFSGTLTLTEAGNAQGFWQTDDAESGIFFELDGVLLRIGIALADGTTARIGTLDNAFPGRINYVVLLEANGKLTTITDHTKFVTQIGAISPTCNNFRFGMGNENSTSGTIMTEVSAGSDSKSAIFSINKYSSHLSSQDTFKNATRLCLVLAVMLILVGNPFKPQKQDEESQSELV